MSEAKQSMDIVLFIQFIEQNPWDGIGGEKKKKSKNQDLEDSFSI